MVEQKKLNVLIFPGGMENGLEIYKALRYSKNIRLFSASSNVPNQAFFVYKNNNVVRDIREDGWVDDLNRVVRENNIDLIYPANSFVIDHLLRVRDAVAAPILLPSPEILRLTRSKKNTINALTALIPVPVLFGNVAAITEYPAFAKPDDGYGAQGACVLENAEQASKIDFDRFIVQEFLPGREYTVDCFSDSDGKLLFSGARERSRVRMATSMHAEIVDAETETLLRGYAEKIAQRVKISGAWFFQVKQDKVGVLRLLEIDVRIAGTMCFNRARGINFPLLSVLQFMGQRVSTMVNPQGLVLDRCLRNRYIFDYQYDAVYVDLDDTIIVHDHINLELIQFLFQCVNNKKKIVLLTKHLGADLSVYLKTWRISELFDEIVWMKEAQSKADYIREKQSIYIDDSFSQRREVHERIGIPTFDCSMVEALLDDRI